MFELLLTDGTTHVQRHAGGAAVLYHVRKSFAIALLLLQIVKGAEIGRCAEDGMAHAFLVFEVRRVLKVAGDAVR